MFRLGYNTNGLAHHRLADAFELLAGIGYRAVAITPDVGELDPFALDPARVRDLRRRAEDLDLALAIETGARYVLDPLRKHAPNLLDASSAGRERRVDFYRRSIDLAVDLGAPLVSLWSGASDDGATAEQGAAREELWDRLVAGLVRVLDHARARRIRVAFEPEPGMFVERPGGYLELVRRLSSRGQELGLTLDLGHVVVTRDGPAARAIRDLAPHVAHVHLDDARAGVHEHLPFGRGELDLVPALAALGTIGFGGMAAVELSRDSHRGPLAAREAFASLADALRTGRGLDRSSDGCSQ